MPSVLAATSVLVLNDHVLKSLAPGWMTGKLSDLAGLYVAPVVLAAAIELVWWFAFGALPARDRLLALSALAVMAGFTLVKLVPAVADGYGWTTAAVQAAPVLLAGWAGNQSVAITSAPIAADATDLIALPMAALTVAVGTGRLRRWIGAGPLKSTTLVVLAAAFLVTACGSTPSVSSEPQVAATVVPATGAPAAEGADCAAAYEWCPPTTPTVSGAASAAVLDTPFNPEGSSSSYLAQGTSLIAIRNRADDGGEAGSVRWTWQTPRAAELPASPALIVDAVGSVQLLVPASDGSLYKVAAATGATLASRDTRRCLGGPCGGTAPLVCQGDTLVGSPAVQRYGEATPAFRAAADAAGHANDDLVFILTTNGCGDETDNRILALWAADLTTAWTFNGPAAFDVGPGAASCVVAAQVDTVYCATDLGETSAQPSLWALDTLTGAPRWSAAVGAVASRPVIVGTRLYVASFDGTISAFDLHADPLTGGGVRLWSVSVGFAIDSHLAAARNAGGRALLAANSLDALVLVTDDGANGSIQGPLAPPAGARFTSSPAIVSSLGLLYLGLSDGRVTQVDLARLAISGMADVNRLANGTGAPVFESALDVDLVDIRVPQIGTITESLEKRLVAQVMKPTLSGLLAEVRLPVTCSTGTLTVDIRQVVEGQPSDVAMTSQIVAAADLPAFSGDPAVRPIRLGTPAPLSAGSAYAIVLSSDGDCAVHRATADVYSSGFALVGGLDPGGDWQPLEGDADLAFETVGFPRLVVAAAGVGDGPGTITRLVLPLQPPAE